MPTIINIPIQTKTNWKPTFRHQRATHAILFQAWQQVDRTIAATIHDMPVKPFTQALMVDDDGLNWRISLLDDQLCEPLLTGMGRLSSLCILEHPVQLQLDCVTTTHQPYASLARTARNGRYGFRFQTPTTFRQGELSHPVPNPFLCVQSWWTRWNQFAPPDHAINIAALDVAHAHLVISRFNMGSRTWRDGKRHLVGGVGSMTFHIKHEHKLSAEWWQAIATLAAFGPFCGTGYKTTQGMGQTMQLA